MMLSKEATSALISWKPVNDRIITTRFLSRHTKTTSVQVYAPTEDAEETEKDAFYNQLQDVISEVPRHDVTVLCGDFNAQIGANRQGLEHVIGPYGTGRHTTNNGEHLLLFCNTNGLCIGNTFFAHKQIHKKTWCEPNGLTNNEIDYICISRRWRSALQDTRVYRGADVGSDHHLLKAVLKLRLKKQRAIRSKRLFNVEKLKNDAVKHRYQQCLTDAFQNLENCAVEDQWSSFNNMVISCAEEVVGRRRGTQRERWIQEDTWKLIDERKITKQMREQARTDEERQEEATRYQILDKRVKSHCRRDKRLWLEQRGQIAQEAARTNDIKSLYRIVKELTGARSNINTPIRDKNGNILLTKEEQVQHWVEHFRETLNQPEPKSTFAFDPRDFAPELQVKMDKITVDEVEQALKKLKSGKAAGQDQIPAELLKHGGTSMIQVLTQLMNRCWEEEQIPDEWCQGMIVKLPKKGNTTYCSNWRGITLLLVPGKAFCTVLLVRLRDAVDVLLREEQAGFRHGRSCTEQIFTLRNIMEQCVEFQHPLVVNFRKHSTAFTAIHSGKSV